VFEFVLGGVREDSREGVDAVQLVIGDDHDRGRIHSRMARRLSSVGYP
jgi:hypothetical protein